MEHMYIISATMIGVLPISRQHMVLPHLYDSVPGYLDAYKKLSDQGDFIMQDNSMFELKRVVLGDLIDFGKRVGATEIVIPEVLRDRRGSIDLAEEFFTSKAYQANSRVSRYAAVVQGSSYADVVKHYNWLVSIDEVNTIGIAFNYEFDAFGNKDETRKHAGWNRFSIIRRMLKDCVWDPTKTHHLFGMYNPAELAAYYRIRDENYPPGAFNYFLKSIRSNDSSSCFWHSLHGMLFDIDEGFLYKKIESHVDFTTFFDKQIQMGIFSRNRSFVENWRKGQGGNGLWNRYIAFAKEEDFVL